MKTTKLVNTPKQTDLTYEKLKTYKGFENITEAEAEKEIEIIKKLAKILYSYMQEQEKKVGENQNNYENENEGFRKFGT